MNNRDQDYYDRYNRDRERGSRQQNQFADSTRQSGGYDRGESQMGGSYESGYGEGPYRSSYRSDDDRSRYVQNRGDYGQDDRYSQNDSYRRGQRSDARYGDSNRDQQPPYEIPTYDASGGRAFGSFNSEDYGGRDTYGSGAGGGMGGSSGYGYRPTYDTIGRKRFGGDAGRDSHRRDYDEWRSFGEDRGFLDRAGDEIASWFGDEDAARRREMDHSGRGPSNYTRSDERIREDANDHLTRDWGVDARKISVSVSDGEVTLDGHVDSRQAKRRAEDIVDHISGVRHVQNNLRIDTNDSRTTSVPSAGGTGTATSTGSASGLGTTTSVGDRKTATTER